eukprot:sb/3462919/
MISGEHNNVQDALTCIDEIVEKMNGVVNKIFTFDKGCTILVAFGTQGFKMNDDPRRALKTAAMIMPSLENNVSDFKGVSIGVTTGLCFVGVVGHEDRHEYTVIGHQVNLACRIMSNYPFCVACDESTRKLSTLPDDHFFTLPPKVLKGVPPGGLYFRYSESSENSHEETHEKESSSNKKSSEKVIRMVGRAREMDALYNCMAVVESPDNSHHKLFGNIIVVEGQAGFGKTKLLEQFVLIGKHRKYRVTSIPLVIDEMTTPFFAVKMIMHHILELNKPSNLRNKEGVIARYVPEYLRPDMCLLNDLLGTRFPRDSAKDFSFKHLHKLLKVILKEIVGSQSFLFIIDNAEYMDTQSWEFMADLATLKRRTILCLSMRTTNRRYSRAEASILGNARTKKFVLESFSVEEIEEFSKAVLDVRKVPSELVSVLFDKTRGIPLYCEGLLRKMLKEQVIKVVDDLGQLNKGNQQQRKGTGKFFGFSTSRTSFSALRRRSTDLTRKGSDSSTNYDESGGCLGCLNPAPGPLQTISSDERLHTSRESGLARMCVLNDSVSLSKVALPDSVKELFLAQFDRLTVTEQVTMKCCAVLGSYFTLSLLKSVLPHRTHLQVNLVTMVTIVTIVTISQLIWLPWLPLYWLFIIYG